MKLLLILEILEEISNNQQKIVNTIKHSANNLQSLKYFIKNKEFSKELDRVSKDIENLVSYYLEMN